MKSRDFILLFLTLFLLQHCCYSWRSKSGFHYRKYHLHHRSQEEGGRAFIKLPTKDKFSIVAVASLNFLSVHIPIKIEISAETDSAPGFTLKFWPTYPSMNKLMKKIGRQQFYVEILQSAQLTVVEKILQLLALFAKDKEGVEAIQAGAKAIAKLQGVPPGTKDDGKGNGGKRFRKKIFDKIKNFFGGGNNNNNNDNNNNNNDNNNNNNDNNNNNNAGNGTDTNETAAPQEVDVIYEDGPCIKLLINIEGENAEANVTAQANGTDNTTSSKRFVKSEIFDNLFGGKKKNDNANADANANANSNENNNNSADGSNDNTIEDQDPQQVEYKKLFEKNNYPGLGKKAKALTASLVDNFFLSFDKYTSYMKFEPKPFFTKLVLKNMFHPKYSKAVEEKNLVFSTDPRTIKVPEDKQNFVENKEGKRIYF